MGDDPHEPRNVEYAEPKLYDWVKQVELNTGKGSLADLGGGDKGIFRQPTLPKSSKEKKTAADKDRLYS